MKKRILLLTLCAGIGYVTLSSNQSGGAAGPGADGTNATGTGNGCNNCHGSSTSVLVTVELDSAGVPVTQYRAGHTYTLKVSGTNNTTSTLPKYGFQITVVKAAGAGTGSAVNAGTLGTTGLPTGVRYTSAATSGLSVAMFEQSSTRTATTGTGTTGTTYVMGSLPWTTPAAGTGSIVIYGCINAVNGNGGSSGDKWNYATPVTITEASTVEVATISNTMDVNVFPNPVVNDLNIQLNNVQEGTYAVQVYDLTGRLIANNNIDVTSSNYTASINTNSWVAGIYNVIITDGKERKIVSVVKQ